MKPAGSWKTRKRGRKGLALELVSIYFFLDLKEGLVCVWLMIITQEW